MTEAEVVRQMREHLEKQFPQACPHCKLNFGSLREYLQLTTHTGSAMPYDAMIGNWKPLKPLGTMSFANCPCGNTMALTSHGMPLVQLWKLLNWARKETRRRHMSPQALLNYLREEICKQVLVGPEPTAGSQQQ